VTHVDEAEWNGNPSALEQMLRCAGEVGSERKLRLFLHACCIRVEHALASQSSKAVLRGLERYIEGGGTPRDLQGLWDAASLSVYPLDVEDLDSFDPARDAGHAVLWATSPHLKVVRYNGAPHTIFADSALAARDAFPYPQAAAETEAQAALLRCIFGNPFRPVALDPAWRTEAVVGLAAGIYADRAFDRLPVLADALEDAGCANPDVLGHCRSGGPHARGCWVVDLVLGKA
jgi:hypothetical protein